MKNKSSPARLNIDTLMQAGANMSDIMEIELVPESLQLDYQQAIKLADKEPQ